MLELAADRTRAWPALRLADWKDTCDTLHMWTQVVGKIRMALTPPLNHWWHVALYLTSRGLTTSPIPYRGSALQIDFDFIDHQLVIATSAGQTRQIALEPMSVARFYQRTMAALAELGAQVRISTMPQEVENPIPFDEDEVHASYDPDRAHDFWCALLSTQGVLKRFATGFVGKQSPVHFFWGSFDLAYTRFSGRLCPSPPADPIGREGYSHEVWSAGFWPGGRGVDASFYAYAVPPPAGFDAAPVRPGAAAYDTDLGEFVLSYEAVRTSESPEEALLAFCRSTYEAATTLGAWDRAIAQPMEPVHHA